MNIVVLSPHRDDAAFSLSLGAAAWLSRGHRVTVVNCFTRSEYAPFSDAASLHPRDRMSYVSALRGREDQAWLKRLLSLAGKPATNPDFKLHDLNLKDAPLRLRCGVEEVCTLSVKADDKALLRIRKAIDGLAPDALLLPLALGAHVDHLTARDSLLPFDAIPSLLAFYEDLPYAARPGAVDGIPAVAASLSLDLGPAFAEATPLELSSGSPYASQKRRMALCYDSQIDTAAVEAIAGFGERYGGRERFWATPAASQSPLFLAHPAAREQPVSREQPAAREAGA